MLRLKTKRKNNMEAVQETLSAALISESKNEDVLMANAEVSQSSVVGGVEIDENNASVNEKNNSADNGNSMETSLGDHNTNLTNCVMSPAPTPASTLSLMQSSPPPHSYRHSRAYRHFKNPPQPHMCIRTTNDGGEELFINVLSWTRIVIPQEPSDPIPLYGGMRVPPGSPRSPPIVFAVMANPEVLKDSGRHSKDPEERRAMVELMCDFVEAMNPGVKLVRNAVILKDRDISGELKDVWNAVQAQRDREREEQLMQQRQQEHYYNVTTQQMFLRSPDNRPINNAAAMINGQDQVQQYQQKQTQQPQINNDNNKNNLGEDTRLPTGNNVVTMLNVNNTNSFKNELTSQGELMQNNEESDGALILDTKISNDMQVTAAAMIDSAVPGNVSNLHGTPIESAYQQSGTYSDSATVEGCSNGTENRDQIDAVSNDANQNDLVTKMRTNLQITNSNASPSANSKANVDNLSHSANNKSSTVSPNERSKSSAGASINQTAIPDVSKQSTNEPAKGIKEHSSVNTPDSAAIMDGNGTANESTASTTTTASNSNSTVPAPTAPTTKKEKLGGFLPNGCIFPRFKNHKHKDKDKDKEKETKPKDKEKTLLNALKKSKEKRIAPSENSNKLTKNAAVAVSGTGSSSHPPTSVPAQAVEPIKISSINSSDNIITAKATQYEKNCLHIEKEVQKLDLNKTDNKTAAAAAPTTATVAHVTTSKKEGNGMFMKLKISSNNNSSAAAAK